MDTIKFKIGKSSPFGLEHGHLPTLLLSRHIAHLFLTLHSSCLWQKHRVFMSASSQPLVRFSSCLKSFWNISPKQPVRTRSRRPYPTGLSASQICHASAEMAHICNRALSSAALLHALVITDHSTDIEESNLQNIEKATCCAFDWSS